MLTPEQIKEKLQDRILKKVSKASGVDYLTLRNFACGRTKSPCYSLIQALSEYLERNP